MISPNGVTREYYVITLGYHWEDCLGVQLDGAIVRGNGIKKLKLK